MSGTQIVNVEWYALAVPIGKSISDAHASLTHWTVPVVEITTADGLVGTGIGGTHTGADVLSSVLAGYYAPLLLGRDSSLVREIWSTLYTSSIGWIGRSGATHLALSLVDIALWDLAARRSALPLWRYLGARHTTLRTYNTDAGWLNLSIDDLRRSLTDAVDAGWDHVKIKVGSSDWRDDVRRLAAARDVIGPDRQLSCDANKVWDVDRARRVLPALEDLGVEWLEEPLHPDDVRGHALLQSMTSVPIALGESLYSSHSFLEFARADAMRIAQPDVTRLAGVTEYLDVAAFLEVYGVPVVPHAGDMMVVHQHLAAVSGPRNDRIEYLPWTMKAYDEPVRLSGSTIVLPNSPGASTAISAQARSEWLVPATAGGLHA